MKKILIKNGRIFDGEKFFFADVLTENDKIAEIGTDIKADAEYVFDAEGKTVAPGLVDAHVHFKGISSNQFGVDAAMGTVPFGVTAAVDASGIQGDKRLLDSFLVKNKVLVCPEIRDNHAYFDSTALMLENYGDKAVGLKVYFDVSLSQVRDITPLRECVEYAEEKGLVVMVHSSNPPTPTKEILQTLREGDIFTHAYHTGVNNVSDDGFESLISAKKRGVIIDAGLAGHVHTDFKIFKSAIESGASPDIISTDITAFSAYKRGGNYGLTMCMSIARHLGMDEADIFKAVTSSPASAMGFDGGLLNVGKTADVCVIDYADEGFDLTDKSGNRIQSGKGYKNVLTVLNGEIIFRR